MSLKLCKLCVVLALFDTMHTHAPSRLKKYYYIGNMEQYYMSVYEWSEQDRPLTRCRSARAPRTPRTPRALSPRRKYTSAVEEEDRVTRNNERNRRASMARPASARDPPSSTCSRRTSITQRPAFTVY